MKRELNNEQIKQCREWLESGTTIKEIAKRLGIGKNKTSELLIQYGLRKPKKVRKLSDDDKKKIISLKEDGYNTVEISKIVGFHNSTVGSFLRKNGYKNTGESSLKTKDKQLIVEKYVNDKLTTTQISERFFNRRVCPETIQGFLRKEGLIRVGGNYNYYTDHTYFDNIDTPSKAYVLGYLIADGSITQHHSIRLEAAERDREIVEYVSSQICSNAKIHISDRGEKGRFVYCYIGASDMYSSMSKWGLIRKKQGANLHFPQLGDGLMPYFIRGYFDGDGSVFVTGGNIKVSICAEKRQAFDLERILLDQGILDNGVKNVIDMSPYGANIFNVRIETSRRVRLFFNYIYSTNDETVFRLDRKYQIFVNNL